MRREFPSSMDYFWHAIDCPAVCLCRRRRKDVFPMGAVIEPAASVNTSGRCVSTMELTIYRMTGTKSFTARTPPSIRRSAGEDPWRGGRRLAGDRSEEPCTARQASASVKWKPSSAERLGGGALRLPISPAPPRWQIKMYLISSFFLLILQYSL